MLRRDVVLTAVLVATMLYCTARLERAASNIDSSISRTNAMLEGPFATYPVEKPARAPSGTWFR